MTKKTKKTEKPVEAKEIVIKAEDVQFGVKLYAVYGTLLQDLGNHSRMRGSKLLGAFTTTDKLFKMVSLGSFPGIIPLEKGEKGQPIHMEVYAVKPEHEAGIDGLEGYRLGNEANNLYNKIEIETPYGKAFTYIYNVGGYGRGSNNLRVIESGNWREFIKNRYVSY